MYVGHLYFFYELSISFLADFSMEKLIFSYWFFKRFGVCYMYFIPLHHYHYQMPVSFDFLMYFALIEILNFYLF